MVPQPPMLKVTDYLVGPQLDDAIAAGQELTISWPFADGDIKDFMQAEALWYVLPCPSPSRASRLFFPLCSLYRCFLPIPSSLFFSFW
jgi:hypothetical protein